MQKTAKAIRDCTYGNPPRFYAKGDVLVFDSEKCPKHFRPINESPPAENPDENPDAGKTLGDLNTGKTAEQLAAEQTASKPMTVKELAAELDVDTALVKEAAGVTRADAKLSSEQVDQIKAAVAKAPPTEKPAENPDG